MKDFEVSAEPVQEWLSKTEKMVRESSDRLYDLPAKRREQQRLQVMRLWAALATHWLPGIQIQRPASALELAYAGPS